MKPKENRMKEEELIGKRILIVRMVGEPQYTGKTGIVTSIDDIGQIHGTWGGCALSLNYGDTFTILEDMTDTGALRAPSSHRDTPQRVSLNELLNKQSNKLVK